MLVVCNLFSFDLKQFREVTVTVSLSSRFQRLTAPSKKKCCLTTVEKNSLFKLTSVERNILKSENEWLTDSIIFVLLNVLKPQSSISGFQDPIL